MGKSKNARSGVHRSKKSRISILSIGNTLDSQSTLLKLQEIVTFGKRDVRFIAGVRLKDFVPKENPPVSKQAIRA